jgi:pimeloyl-ACP methyl ester carboxylesterase
MRPEAKYIFRVFTPIKGTVLSSSILEALMKRSHLLPALALTLLAITAASPTPPQESLTPTAKTASVNGIQLYYEEYGTGTPLLLLHYFGASHAAWDPFLSDLASDYRVISVDLRGHGSSTNPSVRFTMRQSALDVYSLLDQLGIQKIQAIGASAGAMTLLHMATQQPDRVEAMILVGGTSYYPEVCREEMLRWSPDDPSALEYFRQHATRGEAQARDLAKQFHGFKDNYDDMNFTPPFLSTVRARTLIVHGDRDVYFPVSIAVEMYDAIPRSYLWIYPNGDHLPIFLPNNRAFFLQTAVQFLSGDWAEE